MENRKGYDLLIVIVNKGWSEKVVAVATEHGAPGATVINGRGSGSTGVTHFLGLAVEPEKEIILSAMPETISDEVLGAVREAMNLRVPGTGIAVVLPLKCAVGLFGNEDMLCRRS